MQSHPHVVQIYGYIVQDDEHAGILMELCGGGPLTESIYSFSSFYNRGFSFGE